VKLESKKCIKVDCITQLVDQGTWERLPAERRADAVKAGYRRLEAYGLCRKHRRALPADEVPGETDEQQTKRIKTLRIWEEMQDAADPLRATAEELGQSIWVVKRFLQRHGIEPGGIIDIRVTERQYHIGEIRFLRSAGQGVAQIASQLGWTAEELVMRVHYWRLQGDCDFDFLDDWKAVDREEAWTSEEWMTRARQSQRAFNHAA